MMVYCNWVQQVVYGAKLSKYCKRYFELNTDGHTMCMHCEPSLQLKNGMPVDKLLEMLGASD